MTTVTMKKVQVVRDPVFVQKKEDFCLAIFEIAWNNKTMIISAIDKMAWKSRLLKKGDIISFSGEIKSCLHNSFIECQDISLGVK